MDGKDYPYGRHCPYYGNYPYDGNCSIGENYHCDEIFSYGRGLPGSRHFSGNRIFSFRYGCIHPAGCGGIVARPEMFDDRDDFGSNPSTAWRHTRRGGSRETCHNVSLETCKKISQFPNPHNEHEQLTTVLLYRINTERLISFARMNQLKLLPNIATLSGKNSTCVRLCKKRSICKTETNRFCIIFCQSLIKL